MTVHDILNATPKVREKRAPAYDSKGRWCCPYCSGLLSIEYVVGGSAYGCEAHGIFFERWVLELRPSVLQIYLDGALDEYLDPHDGQAAVGGWRGYIVHPRLKDQKSGRSILAGGRTAAVEALKKARANVAEKCSEEIANANIRVRMLRGDE